MRLPTTGLWALQPPKRANAPGRADALLVSGSLLVLLIETVARSDVPPTSPAVPVCAFVMVALAWRRSAPLLATGVAFTASGVLDALRALEPEAPGLVSIAVLLLFPPALMRWGSGREIVLGSALTLVSVTIGLVTGPGGWVDVFGGYVLVLASFAVGVASRFRAVAHAAEVEQVTLRERQLIARELHDTVAHHVSAIAIRAQVGLAVLDDDPTAARDELERIANQASQTLEEMRSIVRMLREEGDVTNRPGYGLADLTALASPVERPRLVVSLPDPLPELPPRLGAAVFRIAQEAVTNARRHAHDASRVEVELTLGTELVLVIQDDGRGTGSRGSGGFGLLGMRERATLLGGTLEAGPTPAGFRVEARLPRGDR